MISALPPNRPGAAAGTGVGDGSGAAIPGTALCAWLYDVDESGRSRPMAGTAPRPMVVHAGATLHVSVEGGQNSATQRFLKAPPAEGMASEPVTVSLNARDGCWMIRNSGRTNTLRVQQYGLSAVVLRPRSAMPMSGEDVAVWIPVVPREPRASHKSEGFRLLILAARDPRRAAEPRDPGTPATRLITVPRHSLTPSMREALIAYFGPHLSWPPLPAPHVRQQREVEDIAHRNRLGKQPNPQNWARNRHDVLSGKDGLFSAADWYPRLGGPDRSLPNHLAAFHRLVELRSITLARVRRWAAEQQVQPYVIIDAALGLDR